MSDRSSALIKLSCQPFFASNASGSSSTQMKEMSLCSFMPAKASAECKFWLHEDLFEIEEVWSHGLTSSPATRNTEDHPRGFRGESPRNGPAPTRASCSGPPTRDRTSFDLTDHVSGIARDETLVGAVY